MIIPRYCLLTLAIVIPIVLFGEETAQKEQTGPIQLRLSTALDQASQTLVVNQAELQRQAAASFRLAERYDARPRVDLFGDASRQQDVPFTTGDDPSARSAYAVRLRATQVLYDANVTQRLQAAEQLEQAREADIHVRVHQRQSQVGVAHIDLLTAASLVIERQQDLDLATELLAQVQALVDAGSIEAISATRAASQVAEARSALAVAEGVREQASLRLARLLDLHGDAIRIQDQLSHDLIPSALVPASISEALELAFLQRPELAALARQITASYSQAESIQGAVKPRVEAYVEGAYGGAALDDLDAGWALGLSIHIPVTTSNRSLYQQARELVRSQELEQQQLIIAIEEEVRSAFVGVTSALASLASDENRVLLARQELDQARQLLDQGLSGTLAVVEAQRGLTSANLARLTSESALQQSRFAVLSAIGALALLIEK